MDLQAKYDALVGLLKAMLFIPTFEPVQARELPLRASGAPAIELTMPIARIDHMKVAEGKIDGAAMRGASTWAHAEK